MSAALIISFFFLTSFLEIVASIAGICGIIVYLINLMFNTKYSFLVYVVSSIISLILTPTKSAVILYIVFFGIYPPLYSLLNKIKNKILKNSIKIASLTVFSVILSVLYDFVFGFSKWQNKKMFLLSVAIFLILTLFYNLTLFYFKIYYNNILKNKLNSFIT